ncbi:MAG: hypothetical protein Q4D58_05090, partial [Synergistaceae bacterium]|nr:hypothetical protein [Synergistaceae bacterium]
KLFAVLSSGGFCFFRGEREWREPRIFFAVGRDIPLQCNCVFAVKNYIISEPPIMGGGYSVGVLLTKSLIPCR